MSKFIKSVAAAAVLATSASGAQAASLSTDVDVSLPSIIALYCYDSVSVNVSANGLSAALGAAPNATGTGLGAATVTALDSDLGADAQGAVAAMGSSVDLKLNNVCAFRALVTNGVDITVDPAATPTLTNAAGGEIDATGITLITPGTVSAGLGLGVAATPISVNVPLNLANASAPGTYSKADLFTVTVTAN